MALYNEFLNEWSTEWFDKNYLSIANDWDWIYQDLSRNPNVTWEIVQANSKIRWNYSFLSLNPNITRKIVCANPDKPWNYYVLGKNPNATWWNKGHNNQDADFDYYEFIRHPDDFSRDQYIRKRFQEWFKRSELKEELMANVWHPRNFEKFKYLDSETFGEEF